jgi:sialic acid synthase SpsE
MRLIDMNLYKKYKESIESLKNKKGVIEVKIGAKLVSDKSPTFIIAEAANNHMCDMKIAKKLVDNACVAGADAIKFQTYKANRLVRKEATLYWDGKETSQLEYYSNLDKFDKDDYIELFDYAIKKGILPFSTPFDVHSASMLNDLSARLYKIASCDLPDKRLLRHVASFDKPIILSTGGSTLDEIDQAIDVFYQEGNFKIILLACMLSYPTPNKDANLRKILKLKERYPWLVIGLSDHTEPDKNMVIPSLAVALGAKVIEKHYTLDRSLKGSGHFFSVSPEELESMIENIRLTEIVLGNHEFNVEDVELPARKNARRSIVADKPIAKGVIITSNMIGMKRPADGLSPSKIDEVIGKKTTKDIGQDELILMDFLSA